MAAFLKKSFRGSYYYHNIDNAVFTQYEAFGLRIPKWFDERSRPDHSCAVPDKYDAAEITGRQQCEPVKIFPPVNNGVSDKDRKHV